jgi:hypothetical protein
VQSKRGKQFRLVLWLKSQAVKAEDAIGLTHNLQRSLDQSKATFIHGDKRCEQKRPIQRNQMGRLGRAGKRIQPLPDRPSGSGSLGFGSEGVYQASLYVQAPAGDASRHVLRVFHKAHQ